jgi:DNA-directed RNA polymerase specialized sigma24 family protein
VGPEDRQFPEFFVSQYGRLRRLGFLLTGSWSEGEELAQETLVRIYWRWSLLRRLRLEARHAGRDRAEAFDLGPHEDLMVVRAAIRRLPARQRTVLVLRYHQDLPEQEVARLLRIPVGTVKSLSSRAMTRLRRDLARQLPDRADSRRTPP